MPELYTKKVDVAIIGSGLAGLLLAHELVAAGRRVLVATKAGLLDSNTRYAQGGLAAVLKDSVTDSRQAHLEDTIKSGAGLVDEAVAEQIINGGAELVSKSYEASSPRYIKNGRKTMLVFTWIHLIHE